MESLNWWWSKFGESGHLVFRATSPLSRGTLKSKGGGKLSMHFCADGDTIETVFRTIVSVNQLSIYGASLRFVWGIQCLSNKNEETRVGRTIWPIVCADKFVDENTYTFERRSCTRRSIAKVPKKVEKLSRQNRLIKFCTDAGFLTTVHVGQYFMTKDTEEFSQFTESVACREKNVTKRWKINWPETLDSREHQNWARIGCRNQLPAK